MGITIHILSNVPFLNVYYAARTRTPVRFISIEIGSFNQRLSESSRMAVRELYSFTKQVSFSSVAQLNNSILRKLLFYVT